MPIARKRVVAGLLMGELARKQGIKIDRKRVAEQLAAIASTSASGTAASAEACRISRSRWLTCARAASSGTTPP